MGEHAIQSDAGAESIREFEKHLLEDVQTLERMLENGVFEKDVRRLGAEQEVFLIDQHFQPAPCSEDILNALQDPHFTTEIGRFNIEFNLDPLLFNPQVLTQLRENLQALLEKLRQAARSFGAEVMLVGILPTIRKAHLEISNMSPEPRYFALNDAMTRLRGREYELFIRGTDELFIKHDTVMLEACNTSFQVHFQVHPDEFARLYNICQTVAAPVLAAAANSPLLFGRRLWSETRIAVFQQAIDSRAHPLYFRQPVPRVSFGTDWVKESVLEIFREDIIRFRVLIGAEIDEDSAAIIARGGVPRLRALQIHNSTVYRWNRPCYGITDGKPHLRIENRLLPAGPTIDDEIANAAFWFGLLSGLSQSIGDVTEKFAFDEVKANFIAAARRGLQAQFTWMRGKTIPAQRLILQHLLPLAAEGLQDLGIHADDADYFLGIIEKRVRNDRTGAKWQIQAFDRSSLKGSIDERLCALTAAMLEKQRKNKPVHAWPIPDLKINGDWKKHHLRVEQFMSTDLITVHEEDNAELAVSMMKWRRVRHIPVENYENNLVGLVTYRSLIRYLEMMNASPNRTTFSVRDIMKKRLVTISLEASSLQALELMKRENVTCLPVVDNGRLVGIVTEYDFFKIASQFLTEYLGTPPK